MFDHAPSGSAGTEAGSTSLTAIVPVTERTQDIHVVLKEYLQSLRRVAGSFELICVVDDAYPDSLRSVNALKSEFPELTTLSMPRSFGDATAISMAFEVATGRKILLLPPYRTVVPEDIEELIASELPADVVVGRREPRLDGWFNRLQTRVFSAIVSRISGLRMRDAGCPVRLLHREVLEEIQLYGDFHRFLPMLASRQGFRVEEFPVRQANDESGTRLYAPGIYLRRFLDLISVYFILRFTKKPFRFFGLIGSGAIAIGALVTVWVVVERFLVGTDLADRPALLLGSLLMVFGIQILSVGLIGEIIIFAHAREMKEFNVRRVIAREAAAEVRASAEILNGKASTTTAAPTTRSEGDASA